MNEETVTDQIIVAHILYNLKTIHLISCYDDHSFYFFPHSKEEKETPCDIQLLYYKVLKIPQEKTFVMCLFPYFLSVNYATVHNNVY